jgi:hypothetical protein
LLQRQARGKLHTAKGAYRDKYSTDHWPDTRVWKLNQSGQSRWLLREKSDFHTRSSKTNEPPCISLISTVPNSLQHILVSFILWRTNSSECPLLATVCASNTHG